MKIPAFSLLLACLFSEISVSQTVVWPFEKPLDSLVFSKKYRPENPGFAVMVIQNGRVVYEKQNGMANLKKDLKIGPETMFNIGSITKQFTAACIFLLEERGQIRRTDSIQKHLPELPGFGKTITLDHLLGHTSGIPDHFEVAGMQNRKIGPFTRFEKMVEWLRADPILTFEPGSDFAYSNTGYMLLAMVVERVSGQKIDDFARKNLFEPLGMSHANFFQYEREGLPDGTTSYLFQSKKGRFKHLKPTPNATGATGVQMTLRDFFRWDQNFYHNQFGTQSLIEKMETTYFLANGAPTNYGGGLFLKPFRGLRMVSHTGGWSSFLMDYRQFPSLETSILVASNNDFSSPFSIADSICKLILPPPVAVAEPFKPDLRGLPIKAQKLEGTFLSANNFTRRVRLDSAGLTVVIPSAVKEMRLRLRFQKSIGDSLIFLLDERGDELIFKMDESKNVTGFSWEGGHFFRVQRFYEKLKPTATASEIGLFVGKYRSNARKQTIRVKQNRRTGQLKLKPVFFLSYPLEPIGGAAFQIKGEKIIVRFQSDGLILGNDWVSGLKMNRVK